MGKKKRKLKQTMLHRGMGILLAVVVGLNPLSMGGLVVSALESRENALCEHHIEHDENCGYQPASEDGEGSPCTYKCRICPVEDLIAALPDTVTEDNADDARAQLEEILALYRELDEEEQAQIDLSYVTELQEALDNANAPMMIAGEIKLLTYNSDTQTTTFNADDTITVRATLTATGAASQKAAARLRGGYTEPTAGQMALFVGDVQVSEPVQAGEDGTYTMTVSASEVLLQGNAEQNGNAITLTAKFVGNDNMADAAGTVDVRISAVAVAEKDGEVIGYFGVRNFEGTNNLFCQNVYANATITLLDDVQPSTNSDAGTTCSTMVNITCTLDLDGHKFTSTDIAIYVLPMGNLIIQDSSTGKTGQIISNNAAAVVRDGVTTLKGGTYTGTPAIKAASDTLSGILPTAGDICYAFYQNGQPIPLTEWQNKAELTDPITVEECQHTGIEVTNLGDGKHGLICPCCGKADTEQHNFSETGYCPDCKLQAVAKVEKSGNDTVYVEANGLNSALSDKNNADAVFTLLKDVTNVEREKYLSIKINCTLDLNGHTIHSTGQYACAIGTYGNTTVTIRGEGAVISEQSHGLSVLGTVTLEGGTFTSKGDQYCGVYVNSESAELFVTGESVVIQNVGSGYGLGVNAVKSVSLLAGTYLSSTGDAIYICDYGLLPPTVGDFLRHTDDTRYAYYQDDALVTKGLDSKMLAGTVTVKPCTHAYEYTHETGTTVHCQTCPACGDVKTDVTCSYDATTGRCACGSTLEVTLSGTEDLVYNGAEQKPAVAVTVDGQTLTAENNYTVTYANNINAGDTAEATVTGETFIGTITLNFTIKQAESDVGTVTAETLENTLDVSQVGLSRTNQTLAGTLMLTDSTLKYGTNTYTWKFIPDNTSYKTVTGEVEVTVNDTIPPTGEISVGTNKWNSFLNKITFGLFFKKTDQVTITAQDNESGVASVSYYLSDSERTEEEVKGLDHWTAGNKDKTTFSISKDESCVVYTKIADNQGNVTYISSNGLVFDGTFPVITGVTNGGTYCTPQTVTVTDDNLKSVTVNGEEEVLSDNKFILDVKFDTAAIVIAAEDKAGNVTTVTVNAAHDYGIEWKFDSDGHWQKCVVCGNESEAIIHTEDSGTVTKPATETETGIRTYQCSVCGYKMRTEIIEKLPPSHTHSYGTEWKSDSNNHWHECDCGAKSDSGTHTEDGGTVTKPATETETGIRTYQCSVCGYEMRTEIIEKLPPSPTPLPTLPPVPSYVPLPTLSPIPSHTHSYGMGWKSDENGHWKECNCGDKSEISTHTEDSGSITKPATENETGIRTYQCSICGYVIRTEIIEKLSPSPTLSPVPSYAPSPTPFPTLPPAPSSTPLPTLSPAPSLIPSPTLSPAPSHIHSYGMSWKSNENVHWKECICGDKSEISAHTEDSGSITKPATETETGIKTYQCSVCGYVIRTDEIEKLSPSHIETSQPEDNQPEDNRSNNDQPENNQPEDNQSANSQPEKRPDDKKPETNNTEEIKLESGKPFIKEESGNEDSAAKSGWENIREETKKTEEGTTIIIDMNGSAIVPGDVLENIRGRDITTVIDIGNNITWSVNGKNMKEDKIKDIDFSVQTNTEKIPTDIINNVIRENYSVQISLSHKGEFGFTAVLSINLGKENAGLDANLYYYIENTGELEFICTNKVTEDGMVSLEFTHASDYVIEVVDKAKDKPESGINDADDTTEDKKESETNDANNADNNSVSVKEEDSKEQLQDTDNQTFPYGIVIIGILLATAGIICMIFIAKKKKKDA